MPESSQIRQIRLSIILQKKFCQKASKFTSSGHLNKAKSERFQSLGDRLCGNTGGSIIEFELETRSVIHHQAALKRSEQLGTPGQVLFCNSLYFHVFTQIDLYHRITISPDKSLLFSPRQMVEGNGACTTSNFACFSNLPAAG